MLKISWSEGFDSAAGVASMGILQIDFLWYVKRISLYALIDYLAGIAVFVLGL